MAMNVINTNISLACRTIGTFYQFLLSHLCGRRAVGTIVSAEQWILVFYNGGFIACWPINYTDTEIIHRKMCFFFGSARCPILWGLSNSLWLHIMWKYMHWFLGWWKPVIMMTITPGTSLGYSCTWRRSFSDLLTWWKINTSRDTSIRWIYSQTLHNICFPLPLLMTYIWIV